LYIRPAAAIFRATGLAPGHGPSLQAQQNQTLPASPIPGIAPYLRGPAAANI